MKKKLLLFINLIICFFVYSEELMEKKQELKEQIVKNFKENNNDTNLIIDYAKLFLPKTFIYDDNKMKTPTLSENNYNWTICFVIKNEYITEDLFKDDIAVVGYTVTVRKVTGEAMLNGYLEQIRNVYQIQYMTFQRKINQYDSLLKSMKKYSQFCNLYKRMNYLADQGTCVNEDNLTNYVDTVSKEILKIKLYKAEESLKETYDKYVISCITYYKNEEELISAYLLNDKNYDLLISINDASERKIYKYLISKTTNEFQEEIINY